jgi:hypothetical protein
MDEETLARCEGEVGNEEVSSTLPATFVAANLTPAEQTIWQKCAKGHLRLEQENIRPEVSGTALTRLAATQSS